MAIGNCLMEDAPFCKDYSDMEKTCLESIDNKIHPSRGNFYKDFQLVDSQPTLEYLPIGNIMDDRTHECL